MRLRGYRRLQGVTGGYWRLQGVTRGYRGLQEVTSGDKRLQAVTLSVVYCFYKITFSRMEYFR